MASIKYRLVTLANLFSLHYSCCDVSNNPQDTAGNIDGVLGHCERCILFVASCLCVFVSKHAAGESRTGTSRCTGFRVNISAMPFVSRAGQKLEHAMAAFGIDVAGMVCADLGSNTGGFVDCLLQRGAMKVYAIDTGYGVLDYRLRKDPRVVVMERTNAMHVSLPETPGFISIDVAWTKQKHILPAARRLLGSLPSGQVVSLVKPHYEAQASMLRKGILQEEHLSGVLEGVKADITAAGFELLGLTDSPILGAKGNRELLAWLRPSG